LAALCPLCPACSLVSMFSFIGRFCQANDLFQPQSSVNVKTGSQPSSVQGFLIDHQRPLAEKARPAAFVSHMQSTFTASKPRNFDAPGA
jgi:hypothetical protein